MIGTWPSAKGRWSAGLIPKPSIVLFDSQVRVSCGNVSFLYRDPESERRGKRLFLPLWPQWSYFPLHWTWPTMGCQFVKGICARLHPHWYISMRVRIVGFSGCSVVWMGGWFWPKYLTPIFHRRCSITICVIARDQNQRTGQAVEFVNALSDEFQHKSQDSNPKSYILQPLLHNELHVFLCAVRKDNVFRDGCDNCTSEHAKTITNSWRKALGFSWRKALGFPKCVCKTGGCVFHGDHYLKDINIQSVPYCPHLFRKRHSPSD